MISIDVKKHCVELYNSGKNSKEVYNEYFKELYPNQSYQAFEAALRRWRKKTFADSTTLESGTYPQFVAHGATVQVNKNGDIVQAWIRQSNERSDQIAEIIEAIKENVEPIIVEPLADTDNMKMLEIPLYDMHFPLSDYQALLSELLSIIERDNWNEINIVIGQDLFHNDDFRGRTTSGRVIDKLDMVSAWNNAKTFWYNVITECIRHARYVRVIYSKGNHDETLAWAFVQMLKVMFPTVIFDDDLKRRKCIYWNGCFIGISHGCENKSQNRDLRGQFTIDFPKEFAGSKVREIHAGHLHHEREADIYGVMIRRLCSATPENDWSNDEGYVGAHKRFMIFEWKPNRLSSIFYLEN